MGGGSVAGKVDSEGVIIGIRWAAVVFAMAQTATYYRPFPDGVAAWAWRINVAFVLIAVLLTVWWWYAQRSPEPAREGLFGAVSLGLDAAIASAITWIYAFDANTAIFVILYIVAIEGASRWHMPGALLTMAALTVVYAIREVWAHVQFGTEILAVSVTFRMGVGFLLAAFAGSMAGRYAREHRRLQLSFEQERARAQSLRSLEELRSTFLAAVSHELRTPLTSILGFALTIQQRSGELSPPTQEMLSQVVAESRHLEQLLQDLLDVERMGRGSVAITRRETDIAQIARTFADRHAQHTGRQITVEGPHVVLGIVDGPKVERIVDNLIENALKYSPEDTDVRVHVSRDSRGVLLVVNDCGPGVPDHMRATIFAPFERGALTSAHAPGTGIGLTLVERFARLHGGRAWVEQRSDGDGADGASFRVVLPDGVPGVEHVTVGDMTSDL